MISPTRVIDPILDQWYNRHKCVMTNELWARVASSHGMLLSLNCLEPYLFLFQFLPFFCPMVLLVASVIFELWARVPGSHAKKDRSYIYSSPYSWAIFWLNLINRNIEIFGYHQLYRRQHIGYHKHSHSWGTGKPEGRSHIFLSSASSSTLHPRESVGK